MIVENRSPELKYPRAIRQEKIRLVLDWLLEFRFSTIPVLAARLGQSPMNANRFFRSMLSDGLIQEFSNVHTKHYRYVMLAAAGIAYLEAEGRDISGAINRPARLGKYSRIIHDLAVQTAAITFLSDFSEIVSERNVQWESAGKPDLLAFSIKNRKWVALEYERWRKGKNRIFMVLSEHARNLMKKRYAGVYYLFEHEADRKHYLDLFNETHWPQYTRKASTGKVTETRKAPFEPDRVENLRAVFTFRHMPLESLEGIAT